MQHTTTSHHHHHLPPPPPPPITTTTSHHLHHLPSPPPPPTTSTTSHHHQCGLEASGGVGLLGFNSAEWFISYFGCIMGGGLATGIYSTNCPEACHYVLHNAHCNVAVVENQQQLDKILKVLLLMWCCCCCGVVVCVVAVLLLW